MSAAVKPRWLLPLKVAALVTVIGPAAGALILAVLAFLGEAYEVVSKGNGHLKEMILAVPWFFFMGYLFGTLPALVGGVALALYMHLTRRQPWAAGLVIGTLAPPLCLAAMGVAGLPQSPMDWEWLRDTGKFALFAAGLGFGAALITALAIRLVLRRSIAEHFAKT